jgi:hypothetical protein
VQVQTDKPIVRRSSFCKGYIQLLQNGTDLKKNCNKAEHKAKKCTFINSLKTNITPAKGLQVKKHTKQTSATFSIRPIHSLTITPVEILKKFELS